MSTTEPWMCGDAFANVRPKPHRSSPVRLIPSGNSHLALPLKQRSDHWYDAILVHYHSSLQIQKAEEPLPLATSPSEEQLGFRVTCKFRLPGAQGQVLPSKVTSDSSHCGPNNWNSVSNFASFGCVTKSSNLEHESSADQSHALLGLADRSDFVQSLAFLPSDS